MPTRVFVGKVSVSRRAPVWYGVAPWHPQSAGVHYTRGFPAEACGDAAGDFVSPSFWSGFSTPMVRGFIIRAGFLRKRAGMLRGVADGHPQGRTCVGAASPCVGRAGWRSPGRPGSASVTYIAYLGASVLRRARRVRRLRSLPLKILPLAELDLGGRVRRNDRACRSGPAVQAKLWKLGGEFSLAVRFGLKRKLDSKGIEQPVDAEPFRVALP